MMIDDVVEKDGYGDNEYYKTQTMRKLGLFLFLQLNEGTVHSITLFSWRLDLFDFLKNGLYIDLNV